MGQQVQVAGYERTATIYDLFNRPGFSAIKTGFKGLDEKVRTAYNNQIIRDSEALRPSAPIEYCVALESRLVMRLASNKSYGSVATNEIIGNYLDAIAYINFLQEKSETDKNKVDDLKLALIKTLIKKFEGLDKIPDYAERFVAEPEKGLYIRALKELKSEKPI